MMTPGLTSSRTNTAGGIVARARAVGADLIVLGPPGRGLSGVGAARATLLQAVVAASPVPVLVVRGDLEWPPERVIVGFDGTPGACAALRCVRALVAPSQSALSLVLGAESSPAAADLGFMRQANLERHADHLRNGGLRLVHDGPGAGAEWPWFW